VRLPYPAVQVELDRKRPLRLTFRAYEAILQQTEVDLFAPGGLQKLDTRHLAITICEMLRHQDAPEPLLTLDQVKELIYVGNLGRVLAAMYTACGVDMPQVEPEEGSEDDPLTEQRESARRLPSKSSGWWGNLWRWGRAGGN
jgi:hypothetical protein